MKGVVLLGNKKVAVKEFPDPEPDSNEVLIRMKASAICGSDLHFYRSSREKWPEYVFPRSEVDYDENVEMIAGHEPSGTIEKIGKDVRFVKVGDRVAVYHFRGCGHCEYCLRGDIMLCSKAKGCGEMIQGGDADFMVTHELNCLPLPPQLTFTDGALIACVAGTAYMAIKKIGICGDSTLAVFGLGPVGLATLMMAKAMGAKVVGVEVNKGRLKLAGQFDPDNLINPTACNTITEIRRLTQGEGVTHAIETSGNPEARLNAIKSAKVGAKLAFVGLGEDNSGINYTHVILNQLHLTGSLIFPICAYWEISDFIIKHRLSLSKIVTHRFKIEDAAKAFELFNSGKTGKIIFTWE